MARGRESELADMMTIAEQSRESQNGDWLSPSMKRKSNAPV